MDQERLALLALHFIPGLGDYTIRQLIAYCGSAEQVFRIPRGRLLRVPGIGRSTVQGFSGSQAFKAAEKEIRKAEQQSVELIFYNDDRYPARLKHAPDSPTLLYAKGNLNFETTRSIGIVGTRKCTDYGRRCTTMLIEGLSHYQPLIVSGLAYGIDIHAHQEALRYNLQTVGVMGSGIDIIYPYAHRTTVGLMQERGGILTENPFATKPDAHNFPARNRIIAGLIDVLVVVEAAERGGALITADIANSYDREVMAYPGDVNKSFSVGCNNLIKSNRAHLISSAQDLERIMNWDEGTSAPAATRRSITVELDADEQLIVHCLEGAGKALHIDELSWRTALPIARMATLLLNLELKSVVNAAPGRMYQIAG
ncbi:DNA-processing protein DprA [Chryseolinea sp. T2]|uniref:DNA-processing protein DprA n=1 Tax=Chryseolinea sp. T2 TaxID=3129255 RepID=UPI00307899FE